MLWVYLGSFLHVTMETGSTVLKDHGWFTLGIS